MRIASLLPSATEIVYALGLGNSLVGRSPECDFPPESAATPVVSASVFDGADLDSAGIDATVRRHLEGPDGAGSLYHIDLDMLRTVGPDLILTQGLCEVCAASVDEVRDAARGLDDSPEVMALDPVSLEGILEDILRVGERVGRREAAEDLVASLRARLAAVRAKTGEAPRARVACIEWFDPIFNAGHWVPEQVEVAGGEEVLGTRGKPSRSIPWERVLAAEPEVLVLMPCGFDISRAMREAAAITHREGFADLPAARGNRTFVVNGSAYFNRPGPRTVDGVELLAHLIQPERFPDPWPEDAVQRFP